MSNQIDLNKYKEFVQAVTSQPSNDINQLYYRVEELKHLGINISLLTTVAIGLGSETGEFQEANGKAYLNKADHVGSLRVSFFWPFYGDYKVVDTDYTQYAIVSGNDLDYLWLLAREPEVSDELIAAFEDKASALGYNINELIYVEQTPRGATP